MTTIPQAQCCLMLGIDPKTLRTWLKHANLSFLAHPTDARIKSLTQEQVQQLAILHTRPLQQPTFPLPPLVRGDVPPVTGAAPLSQEAELKQALSCLETKVTTLQEQLTQFALELLHQRSQSYERRLSDLETLSQQTPATSLGLQAFPATVTAGQSEEIIASGRRLHAAEVRARSHALALIEYGAAGTYMAICPKEGELPFPPDSPEWFEWMASLPSFRFVGQQGRFSACRKSSTSRSWLAYRTIHQHDYKHGLGTTDHLTIDCLEHMAAKFQSYMP